MTSVYFLGYPASAAEVREIVNEYITRGSRTSMLEMVCQSLLVWSSQSHPGTVENSCLLVY